MPRLTSSNNMQVMQIPGQGSFQFSAIRLENLGATEYTLVTIVTDITASVSSFAKELLNCVKNIVEACKKSPRSDNLLLRMLTFNTELHEIHGFKPLAEIDPNDYKPFRPKGMTALYDAAYSGIGATLEFSKRLLNQDFGVNGCVYIITDGMDNASTVTPKTIADKMKSAVGGEEIESLVIVLVGLINPNDRHAKDVRSALTTFQVEAELNQFVDAGDATPQRLAKLAQFVSQSISAQSQALGTGSPSQPLTF
ncbi:MAG: hypothetical protein HQK76_19020 [Desulfobacterales bacterium]|nr:hypothetical protein [Desulfobacterales bacterium]